MKTIESKIAPNPKEAQIWVDLRADAQGTIRKIWNGKKWVASDKSSEYDNLTAELETSKKTIKVLQEVITNLNKTLITVVNRVNKLEKIVMAE